LLGGKLAFYLNRISQKLILKLSNLGKLRTGIFGLQVILLYVLTSALVPNGSGPDSGAHLVNTFCAFGTKSEMCEVKNLDEKVVWREVNVPSYTFNYGACFSGSVEIGASCAEPFRSAGINSISFSNQDFKNTNNEILFVQRVGRDIYSARIFGVESKIKLRLFLNHEPISQYIELEKLNKSCGWPCANYENKIPNFTTNESSILTFIPQLSTRSVQLYLNGERVFTSGNRFKPYTSASLGKFVYNDVATKVDNEVIKSIWKEKLAATGDAIMVDNYNAPVIYKFYNLIIEHNIAQAYQLIKVTTIFVLALSLFILYSLFGASKIFYLFVNSLLVSSVIYGFYIFGTNNTSNAP
jgi:hypothetical protein